MTLSDRGINCLKDYESLSLSPYDDQTGKIIVDWNKNATIGYGFLIKKKDWYKFKDGICLNYAESLFHSQVYSKTANVDNTIKVEVNQNQFDAMVILTYNIGNRGFRRSSVAKLVNDSNAKTPYRSLELAWKAWKKSNGKVMKGLINRRKKEWRMYNA